MELIEEGRLSLVIEKRGVEKSLFPLRYHPRHPSLQAEIEAWAASTLGQAYAEDVKKLQLALLGSTFWPSANGRRILTLLKLMYWLLLADDVVDNSCKHPSNEVKALYAEQISNSLRHAIFGDVPVLHAAPFHAELPALIIAALQMCTEMRDDGMPSTQQARFRSQFITYLQSLGKEQFLNSAVPPSLEEYTAFRSKPAGTGMLFVGAEYGLGIELSQEALANPLVKELQAAAGEHINLLNDIFSFEKEFANKDHFMNLLYVLHMRNNAGPSPVQFDAAVSQAWQIVDRRQRDCARLTHEILLSPHLLASSPGLDRYAEALCLLTSGNWFWTTQAARYKPQPCVNASLKPFRRNALKPLPRTAVLKFLNARTSVGMFSSPISNCKLAIADRHKVGGFHLLY